MKTSIGLITTIVVALSLNLGKVAFAQRSDTIKIQPPISNIVVGHRPPIINLAIGKPTSFEGVTLFQDAIKARDAKIAYRKNVAAEKARKVVFKAQQAALVAEQQQIAQEPATPPPAVVQPPQVIVGCGDNSYANYIYMHESGCDVSSTNSGGCYGIGQDCNGIVRNRCGADYACQNAYFTQYADSIYGGWAGAYSAWLGKGWW